MSNTTEIINQLITKKELSAKSVESIFKGLFEGSINEAQAGAILSLWRSRKETPLEIFSALSYVLQNALHCDFKQETSDIVGTGGDGFNTINVSTIASFVAAAGGITIAKHGNVASSSKCGSADVLQGMGLNLYLPVNSVVDCLAKTKWSFLFAPIFHPAFLQVRKIRADLKIRTIFNIIGPLANPANPSKVLVGVSQKELLQVIPYYYLAGKNKTALIVHGSGLDEITIHDKTDMVLVKGEKREELTITPQDLGLKKASIEALKSGKKNNCESFESVLSATGSQEHIAFVVANAGALLWINEKHKTLKGAVELAKELIYSGKALNKFREVKEFHSGIIPNN